MKRGRWFTYTRGGDRENLGPARLANSHTIFGLSSQDLDLKRTISPMPQPLLRVIVASVVAASSLITIPNIALGSENYSARLTYPGTLGPDQQSTWSDDSRTVFFRRWNNDNYKIFKQDIGSTRAKFVTYGSEPSVSPGEKYLAFWPNPSFWSEEDDPQPIKIMDLKTKTVMKVIDPSVGLYRARDSAWSPDGRYLYFSGEPSLRHGMDLFRYDVQEDAIEQVTENLGMVGGLSISSDSKFALGYAFSPVVNGNQGSVKIDLLTGEFEPLQACGNAFPTAIPGSTDVICATWSRGAGYTLARKDSSGQVVQVLDTELSDPQARVSPNGSFVVYNKLDMNTRTTFIWIQSLDGSTPTKVNSPQTGISINGGAIATNSEDVTISVVAPDWATEILVANDGSFADSSTFLATDEEIPWSLDSYPGVTTRVVYVRFGSDMTFTDDIILDLNSPAISRVSTKSTLKSQAAGSTSLVGNRINSRAKSAVTVNATFLERESGLARVEWNTQANDIGSQSSRFPVKPMTRKYKKTFTLSFSKSDQTGYFRVQDKAGNWSSWAELKF